MNLPQTNSPNYSTPFKGWPWARGFVFFIIWTELRPRFVKQRALTETNIPTVDATDPKSISLTVVVQSGTYLATLAFSQGGMQHRRCGKAGRDFFTWITTLSDAANVRLSGLLVEECCYIKDNPGAGEGVDGSGFQNGSTKTIFSFKNLSIPCVHLFI